MSFFCCFAEDYDAFYFLFNSFFYICNITVSIIIIIINYQCK